MLEPVIISTYYESGEQIDVTTDDYEKLVVKKNQKEIAKIIYHRLFERYIKIFVFSSDKCKDKFIDGFAMVANACLLIESLESFYNGLEKTEGQGKEVFNKFFERDNRLSELKNIEFYKNVRCGILHQGETTGGIKIRKGVCKLYDKAKNIIYANIFLNIIHENLEEYRKRLENSEWDSEIWDNCRRKMRFIIKNCQGK